MALRVRVCRSEDIQPGEVKGFSVPGITVPILVTNVDGAYLATSSICPHEHVSLLRGRRSGLKITCPAHGYQFDLATGACRHDPALNLPRYRVSIVDGDLYVDLIGSLLS